MGVDDTTTPVATLLPEVEMLVARTVGVGIEGHAKVEQIADEPGPGLGYELDDTRVRDAGAGT